MCRARLLRCGCAAVSVPFLASAALAPDLQGLASPAGQHLGLVIDCDDVARGYVDRDERFADDVTILC